MGRPIDPTTYRTTIRRPTAPRADALPLSYVLVPKDVFVAYGDGGKLERLVVVDPDVDVDGPAVVVDDAVYDLVGHHSNAGHRQR